MSSKNLNEKIAREATTICINGKLCVGDLVISTPDDDYACLIGTVLAINPVGTPEHDAETENETDDIHVNFMAMEYPRRRMKEIAAMFSDLYVEKKDFWECPIDDTIMSPECLIRISGIDSELLHRLLSCEDNAKLFCQGAKAAAYGFPDSGEGRNAIFPVIKPLPNGTALIAETWDEPEYPGIRISLCAPGRNNELLCFVEHSSIKPAGKELCIAAYSADHDEPAYYESYNGPGSPSPNV